MQKNKIVAIIICLTLCLPVFAEPETVLPHNEQQVQETVYSEQSQEGQADVADVVDEARVNDETTINSNEQVQVTPSPYKQPIGKRKIIKKFLLAMLGVAGSAISIFAFLSLYNFIRKGVQQTNQPKESADTGADTSLETPDNTVDAVRTFLDKTNWD